jgi:PAS domain S-box-containing protein
MNTRVSNVVTLLTELASQWVPASVIVALVSALVALVVSVYLWRGTVKNVFRLWSGAWACYSIYLLAALFLEVASWRALRVVCLAASGISALLVLACGWETAKQRYGKWVLWLGAGAVVGLSAGAVLSGASWFWLMTVEFLVLAIAAIYAGLVFRRQRDRSTRVLAFGLIAWGVTLGVAPVLGLWPATKLIGYVALAVPPFLVAIGMVVMEESLALERRQREVLDALTTAIFMVDIETLQVLDANRAAQQLVKYNLAELLGMGMGTLCPELQDAGKTVLDHRTSFDAVFKPYREISFKRKNGDVALCEGETHIVQWRDRPVLQVAVREMDKGKSLGQLLRRSEKLSSLGQLVAGVAHELNNPLAVVLGNAQIMAKQPLADEKTRAMAEKILQESGRAAKIVRDLLSFARPGQPQLSRVDVNKLVGNLVANREMDCRAKNIQCNLQLATDLPPTMADPLQIEQVLNNLITNAIHAMAESRAARQINITTTSTASCIRMTVSDTGNGISTEIIGKIFDPFFTTKGPGKGTGLGLSICNTIMQEHRGKIWAESSPGQGASFHVELPIVACADEPVAPALAEPEKPVVPPPSRKSVLLVDDEPGIRDVLAEVLSTDGYEVDVATGGEEAWKRINARSFDVIISDLNMPGMDGETLYRHVLSLKPKQAQRMVFLTGDTIGQKWHQFLERTKNPCLTKPFNIREIEELVATMTKTDAILTSGH